MRRAAQFGNRTAQLSLANRYEKGAGVPVDPVRAEGAQGDGECQYRLASLMLARPGRSERENLQAIAWLQAAAARGVTKAKPDAERETSRLTPDEAGWLNLLKAAILRN
jgi:TPR repeat protein